MYVLSRVVIQGRSFKAKGHAFSSGCRACDLCLSEKLAILTADQNTMLNKRDNDPPRHQILDSNYTKNIENP